MIARIKGASMKAAAAQFLAMYRHEDGNWCPITGDPVASFDQAIQTCLQDACTAVDELEEQVANRLRSIGHNIERLLDQPRKPDQIRIGGRVCEVDDERTVILEDEIVNNGPPWSALDVQIDHKVFETLKRAIPLTTRERSRAIEVMMGMVLGESSTLLVAVAKTEPDMLGAVAAFIAEQTKRARPDLYPLDESARTKPPESSED